MSSAFAKDLIQMPVRDRETAVAFVRAMVDKLGLGFHPDDPVADYVTWDRANPDKTWRTFRVRDAAAIQEKLDACFSFCDPYEVGLERMETQDRRDREISNKALLEIIRSGRA